MPVGKFDKLQLIGPNELLVEGPFETHGDVIGDVTVKILIIRDGQNSDPKFAIATVTPEPPDPTKPGLFTGRFSAIVEAPGFFRRDDEVRAIGISVALKTTPPTAPVPPDPPSFETFTWCVGRKVTV